MGETPKPLLRAAMASPNPGRRDAGRVLRGVLRAYGPALVVSAVLGAVAVTGIRREAGGPAAPLDDAFIHLQYAQGLARGHFFEYVAGEGYSSGATSLLWPLLLAPFRALGVRDVALLWPAWLLGTLAHAGVAVEAYRVTRRLAWEAAALGAAAMCSLFGAFAWFAWSGMETVALAWLLLRTARVAAAHCEPERGDTSSRVRALVFLGVLAPLVRPEGALASLMAAVALVHGARAAPLRRRLCVFAPLLGPLVVPLLNRIGTGHAASATAQVKWMIGNPYYGAGAVVSVFLNNVHVLVTNLMDGGDFTALFLPEHASVPILLGAVALPVAAVRRRVPYHGLFVAMVALGSLVPCTYLTFLWNRIRYVWPFAGAWFVLVGCLARELGDLARLVRPRLTAVTPLLAGGFAAALATRLPWALRDLAESASAITRQQVALGRWAAASLPADARIGVNDTGAIAYLSGRRTFDVVGLTTEGEARYWVAGAGSRFEHYERLPPARRPTHFIVYPQWMACPPVLGRTLTEATVLEQSILGGTTMEAHEARWDLLGSGALPARPPDGLTLADEVDVSDLESEAAHGYEVGDTWDTDNQVVTQDVGDVGDRTVADGGRLRRTKDRFRVKLPAGKTALLVMRVNAAAALDLQVSAGGHDAGTVPVSGDGRWVEGTVALPADGAAETVITVTAQAREEGEARFGAFHYWVYAGE
jgi:hypothetical protein